MMKLSTLTCITAATIAAAGAWYAFRPELLWVDTVVSENEPQAVTQAKATKVASGPFHSVAHEGKGEAAIWQQPDGRRVLRLTSLETSNGPDVRVLLISAPDATDSRTIQQSRVVELGRLKGNIGDQNYDVPPEVDVSQYRAVTIWCERFSVNFATAPLRLAGT